MSASFSYGKSIQNVLLNLLYILNLLFCIENTIFYLKSIGFCQHHFFNENQYKIFYWITCTFSTCAFVLNIKNQSTFFYWKSIGFCQHHFSTENQYKIFYWITCTFSTCAFVLKTDTIFSIENQFIFLSIIFLLKISTMETCV